MLDVAQELAGDLDPAGAVVIAVDLDPAGAVVTSSAAIAAAALTWRSTAGRAGGGAPADLGDPLGPELVALAGDG